MKTKIWITTICSIILAITLTLCLLPRKDYTYAAEPTQATYIVLDKGGALFYAKFEGKETAYSNGTDVIPNIFVNGIETFNIQLVTTAPADPTSYTYMNEQGELLNEYTPSIANISYSSVSLTLNGTPIYVSSTGMNDPTAEIKLGFSEGTTPLYTYVPGNGVAGDNYQVYNGDRSGLWTINYKYSYGNSTDGSFTYTFILIDAKSYTKNPGQALTFANVDLCKETEYNVSGTVFTYNQLYAYDFGYVDGDNKTVYPTVTYDPSKFKLTYTRTINERQTIYTQSTTLVRSDTEQIDFTTKKYNGDTSTAPNGSYDKDSGYLTITLEEYGLYTFTVEFLSGGSVISNISSGLTGITLAEAEQKSLLFFGANTKYTDKDGELQNFYDSTNRSSINSNIESSITKPHIISYILIENAESEDFPQMFQDTFGLIDNSGNKNSWFYVKKNTTDIYDSVSASNKYEPTKSTYEIQKGMIIVHYGDTNIYASHTFSVTPLVASIDPNTYGNTQFSYRFKDTNNDLGMGRNLYYFVKNDTEKKLFYSEEQNPTYDDLISSPYVSSYEVNIDIGSNKITVRLLANTPSNIISTNQDPVRFEYLGQLDDIEIQVGTEIKTVTSLPSFSQNGTYVVRIEYSYSIPNYNITIKGSQLFRFVINKQLPDYKFVYNDGTEYKELDKVYTNQDIYLAIKKSDSSFDRQATAEVQRADYDSNTYSKYADLIFNEEATPISINGTNYSVSDNKITDNGKYRATLSYGSNGAKVTHEIIIDKNEIAGITSRKVDISNLYTGNSFELTKNNLAQTTDDVYITWNTKESGARIKTTYYYISLKNSTKAGEIKDIGDKIGLTNGYSFDDISAETLYAADDDGKYSILNKLVKNSMEIDDEGAEITPPYIFSADGIYILKFEDEAGNTTTRAILHDETIPYIFQSMHGGKNKDNTSEIITDFSKETERNSNNTVKDTTLILWGDYKTLSISQDGTISSELFNLLTDYIKEDDFIIVDDDKVTSINIPIYSIYYDITTVDDNGNQGRSVGTSNKVGALIYKNNNDQTTNHTNYNGDNKYDELIGEGTYIFTVNAPNGVKKANIVEMNLDETQFTIYATNDATTNGQNRPFSNGSATNFDNIFATFQQSSEANAKYEIESIVIDYYPVATYGSLSSTTNYPFSNTPEKYILYVKDGVVIDGYTAQDTGYIRNGTESDNIYYYTTPFINFDGNTSKDGRYVITRTYVANTSNVGGTDYGDDKKVRKYAYIVDHNEIIDVSNNIGNEIKIVLGDEENNTEIIDFNIWSRNISGNLLFSTNKLPIGFYAPYTKYYYKANGDEYKSGYLYAYLDLILTYVDERGVTHTYTFNNDPSDKTINHVLFPSTDPVKAVADRALVFFPISRNQNINLDSAGKYTFTLKDHTGYTDFATGETNINAYTFTRSYVVKHNAPSIDIITSENSRTLSLEPINNTYYTNIADEAQNSLEIHFTDPSDPYSASIKNVSITKSKAGATSTVNIPVTRGNGTNIPTPVTEGTETYKLVSTSKGAQIFGDITYYQYEFSIELDIDDEYEYVIEVSYLDAGATYNPYQYEGTDYSKATYTVKIDRTKPDTNVDKLIEKDTYLNNLLTGDTADAFKERKDTTAAPSLENYYFYIDNRFKVVQEPNEYGTFYIRAYTDDRPTIDFNRKIYSQQGFSALTYSETDNLISQLNSISFDPYGLFEIVEIDYAGNHRAYIVFLENPDNRTDLFELLVSDDDNINKTTDNTTYLANIVLTSISSYNNWYTIEVKNNKNGQTQSCEYKKNTSAMQRTLYLGELNNVFASTLDSQVSYTITFSSSCGDRTVSVSLIPEGAYNKIPTPTVETVINQSGRAYKINIQKRNDLIVLKECTIKTPTNNQVTINLDDYRDTDIITYQTTTVGLYEIRIKDNFTEKKGSGDYVYTIYVGSDITDSDMYEFTGNVIRESNVYYTCDNVIIKQILDGTTLFVNGEAVEFSGSYALNLVDGATTVYKAEYFNDANISENFTRTFVITNETPEIAFYSVADDSPIAFDPDSSTNHNVTTKNLYVVWSNSPLDMYGRIDSFAARYYTYNDNIKGETLEYRKEAPIYNIGTNEYIFELYNTVLGYSKQVRFTMTDSKTNMYNVEADGVKLLPSPIALDMSGADVWSSVKECFSSKYSNILVDNQNNIEHYFTTYGKNVILNLNIDNYLEAHLIAVKNNGSTNGYDTDADNVDNWISDIVNAYRNDASLTLDITKDHLTIFAIITGETNVIYNKVIAITLVPENNSFTTVSYKSGEETGDIKSSSLLLTSDKINNNQFDIQWDSYAGTEWYKKGNVYYMTYTYTGLTNDFVYDVNESSQSHNVSGSGEHIISIRDWAGNTLAFNGSKTSTITVLDKVVVLVNNEQPVNNMIYNTQVVLSLDSKYINSYAAGSVTITATKNGSIFAPIQNNGTFTFAETGRYEVTINGKYVESGKTLTKNVISFTIIDPTSSRIAWEFTRQPNTYITSVILDDINMTDRIKADMGTDNINNLYLTSSNYGKGTYTITAKTLINDLVGYKTYTFRVRINNEVPIIESMPEKGGTTTGTIVLTYNPGQIYDQIGTSVIRIMTYDETSGVFTNFSSYLIDKSYEGQNNIATIELNQTNTYFVQLTTDNGNVVLSFKVTRKEPLNTLAIILIVVSAVTVVVLVIVFIKLRTRMKIR